MTSNTTTRPPPALSLITSEWVIASDAYIADEHGDAVVVIHSDATHLNPPLTSADVATLIEMNVPRRRTSRRRSRAGLVSNLIGRRLGIQMLPFTTWISGSSTDASDESLIQMISDLLDHRALFTYLDLPPGVGLAEALLNTPVPVLGSPPEAWTLLAEVLKNPRTSPYVIAAGVAGWTDRPLIIVLSGSTGLVIWLGKPFVETVRDHFVKSLKVRLENDAQIRESTGEEQAED